MSAPAPSMYTSAAQAVAAELGLTMGRANLDEFGATLLALAQSNRNLVVVTSDSRGSGKLAPFGQALPGQIVEVGIAEQNLVGIAAGLAACGKKAFAVSPPLSCVRERSNRSRTMCVTPTCPPSWSGSARGSVTVRWAAHITLFMISPCCARSTTSS